MRHASALGAVHCCVEPEDAPSDGWHAIEPGDLVQGLAAPPGRCPPICDLKSADAVWAHTGGAPLAGCGGAMWRDARRIARRSNCFALAAVIIL